MSQYNVLTLNDGHTIPQIGLGVWQVASDIASESVQAAVEAGYRHVDTASIYGNEDGVGDGIRASGIARNELFVTTKLWNDAHGYDATLKAFDVSMGKLGLDHIDLYLIHWPLPNRDLYVDSWKAMIELRAGGRIRSIGVSNFEPEHLDRMIDATGVTPAINQIELHPRFQRRELRDYNRSRGIQTQAWSPLGQGKLLADPAIEAIAHKHGKTTAQIILRWHIENELVVIPKSIRPSRMIENFAIFDFALDDDDMAKIGELDAADGRIGRDPAKVHS